MGKLAEGALALVPVPGDPFVAVVLELGATDVVVVKGEVEVLNWRGAYADGTVTTILSRSKHRKPPCEYIKR